MNTGFDFHVDVPVLSKGEHPSSKDGALESLKYRLAREIGEFTDPEIKWFFVDDEWLWVLGVKRIDKKAA